MFVEEGFRIRFGNGEVIDFYADSAADKENWMNVLSQTVGKGSTQSSGPAKAWTELVLKRERHAKAKQDAARLLGKARDDNGIGSTGGQPRPSLGMNRGSRGSAYVRPPPTLTESPNQQRSAHKHANSQPEPRSVEARRQKTRSLMF